MWALAMGFHFIEACFPHLQIRGIIADSQGRDQTIYVCKRQCRCSINVFLLLLVDKSGVKLGKTKSSRRGAVSSDRTNGYF